MFVNKCIYVYSRFNLFTYVSTSAMVADRVRSLKSKCDRINILNLDTMIP